MEQHPLSAKSKLELEAVLKIMGALEPLDEEGRRRVMWYAADLAGLSKRATEAAGQVPVDGGRMGRIGRPDVARGDRAAGEDIRAALLAKAGQMPQAAP